MADDVTFQTSTLATPPDSTKVATDDVSGAHYQRVKLDLGGDGLGSPLIRGQQADADSIPVTLSTEQAAFIDDLETLLSAIQTATEACQTALEATLTVQGTVTADAGTGPFPVSDNSGSLTVDAPVATPVFVRLSDGSSAISALPVTDNNGALTVDNGGTFAVQVDGNALTALQLIDNIVNTEDNASGNGDSGVPLLAVRKATPANTSGSDGDYEFLQMSAGRLWASAVLEAGTAAIGKLAANSGVDIGDVDVTSLPALAAGTNAVGKLLPPDIDVTSHTNYARKYYTSTGAATDGIVWSPAAGKRWHVTSLIFQVSADATVTFEDDKSGGDDPVLKGEFKAGSGLALTFDEKYPFASGEDAADLIVTTSAGNIYVAVVGYEV